MYLFVSVHAWLPAVFHSLQLLKAGIQNMWNKGMHTIRLIRQNGYMHGTDRNYSLHYCLCGTAHWSTLNAMKSKHSVSHPMVRTFLHLRWDDRKWKSMQCSYVWLTSHFDLPWGTHKNRWPVILLAQKYKELYNFKNPNYSNLQWCENIWEENVQLKQTS